MKKKSSFYNLVEITLAMAVVAVGISGIMGLFVPAVDSSREALAETNSSQSVATLLAFIERQKKANWDTFIIPTVRPASLPVEFDGALPNLTGAGWTEITNLPGIWSTGTDGVYGLTVGEKGSLFCGIAQVWREDLPDLHKPSGVTLSAADSTRICVRVSYPATVPDGANRKERFYILEISKPE